MDTWSFDVFALNDASGDHALKFIFYELLTRYDLINRFKVSYLTVFYIFLFCMNSYFVSVHCSMSGQSQT